MLFDSGESIVTIIRKHWLVYVLRVLLLAFAGLLPVVLASFLPATFREQMAAFASADELFTLALLLWILFLWIGAFVLWTNYYLDIWIVTGKRIIDVNQRTLFHRDITSLRLEKIQDVTVDVSGLLATLFSFGTLTIHTAGDHEDIVIRNALAPARAKEKIMSLHSQAIERPVGTRDFV
jgi:hypothetical protein